MSTELWLAVAVSALGTLLMRAVPFLLMQRRLKSEAGINTMPKWLSILNQLMIAAVQGVSIVPVNPSTTSGLATAIELSVTVIVWRRIR